MSMYYIERVKHLPTQFINTLDSVMYIVVALDDIEKVILFGSCARGTQTDHSDIDLLLIIDSSKIGRPLKQLEQENGTAIYEQFSFNGKKEVELLFADKEVYVNSTDSKSVYKRIKKEGIVLYEK